MSIDVCSATVDQGSIVYDQPVIPFEREIINGLGNIKTILLSNKHIASRVQDGSKDNFLPLSIYNSLIAFLEHDGRSFSFLYTAIGLPR